MVYENCRIYGPYDRNQDNRLTVVVVYPDGRKKTVSYPKYLMETHLERYLDKEVREIDQIYTTYKQEKAKRK